MIFTEHSTPKKQKYTVFSNTHRSFSKIDHTVGHKISLNKFKKIEIISSIFFDHNGLKIDINFKRKTQKYSNTWMLNNMLLNNEWVNNEIRKKIKTYLETNENEHTTTQNLGGPVKTVLD